MRAPNFNRQCMMIGFMEKEEEKANPHFQDDFQKQHTTRVQITSGHYPLLTVTIKKSRVERRSKKKKREGEGGGISPVF